ncbi:MAG: choice-of-anchor Q domain-containing protein [bacterium]|nr:choice-of-anchor Q domain-containing protein [bacterium]
MRICSPTIPVPNITPTPLSSALYCPTSQPTFGIAAYAGGGLDACNGAIQNCIIWGNTAPSSPQLFESSTPTYSCIENWTGGGEGNISPKSGPAFVDPDGPDNDPHTFADNDYRLSAGSPCIDAGMNEDWMWMATDLDGNPRVFYGGLSLTVDMGAYEYGSWLFRISQVLVQTTGGLQLMWTSRPGDEYVVWSCTDLSSGVWAQEATVPSAGASTSWTDPSPSGSRKFYRVGLE